MAASPDLTIVDLRGGMNNQDPKHIVPDDQTVLAQNVEYFFSTLGERRRGMAPADITDSDLELEQAIVHLSLYVPALGTPAESNLVAVGATFDASYNFAIRHLGIWTGHISAVDDPDTSSPSILQMRSQSIHNKWFVAYNSGVDRTHVFDPSLSIIRRVGLAAPTLAPAVADTAVAGVFTGERSYRVRVVRIVSGSQTLLSEPSAEVSIVPSGTNSGVVVTKPTLPNEVETDWVVEASNGDGLWYALATVPTGTSTYTDTVQPSTDYPEFGELSPDIGEYDVLPSVRIIKADQDRLLYMGSWEDAEQGSRVWWSPPYAAPGVGNDERVPSNFDSSKDLDWQDGGAITDASDPINGAFYVFKWSRIYKAQRTGDADDAYSFYLLDPAHGAVPGSVVSGVDEYGRGSVYFIDPSIGPMRISSGGVQQMQNLLGTWRTVNTAADKIVVCGLYYPEKKQVHWWVAADGENTPSLKLVSQTDQIRSDNQGGTTRGWTIATGDIAEAWCCCVVPENVIRDDGSVQLAYRQYLGFEGANVIQVGDVGSTDNGATYRAHIITKPYILAGLLNKWGAMTAILLAEPNADPEITIDIKLTRDFGIEQNQLNTDFVPESTETEVIKFFDQLLMSDARAIQVEFQDPA